MDPQDRAARGNPRLQALLREVQEAEETMRAVRAELDTTPPIAMAGGMRHGNGKGGNGIGGSGGPRPFIAQSDEPDWPIACDRNLDDDSRSAARMSWVALLGAAILGVVTVVYVVAGPVDAAGSLTRAQMTPFDVAAVVLACFDAYLFALAFMGRPPMKSPARESRGNPFFMFAVAARHEAADVASTVAHLLRLPSDRYLVVVIDCGYGTVSQAAQAAANGDKRVIVEPLPGGSRADALNHAFKIGSDLVDRREPQLSGVSAAGLLFGILEPGAWIGPDGLGTLSQRFDRPRCAAVQTHVGILRARQSASAAIEDLETTALHVIAQTARNRSGTSLLTATGAFFRLAALRKLAPQPWTGSVDDELDIQLRLIEMGYSIRSCREACVYRPSSGSLSAIAGSRRRRARARCKAWPQISRLWESRRVSIPARIRMTIDLLTATQPLMPAAILAGVLAVGLIGLPTRHSLIAAGLNGGIGVRALVLAIILLPLAIIASAYHRTVATRTRTAREDPAVQSIPAWALGGITVAYLLVAIGRLLPSLPTRNRGPARHQPAAHWEQAEEPDWPAVMAPGSR